MDAFGGLAGVGVLMAGIGFGWAQFRSGANKAKDEFIETLKDALELEKKKVEEIMGEKNMIIRSHQEQLNAMNKEIGKLQGLQESNEKKIEEYVKILQGRDPEQKQFMKFLSEVARESTRYMKETSVILQAIAIHLNISLTPIVSEKDL